MFGTGTQILKEGFRIIPLVLPVDGRTRFRRLIVVLVEDRRDGAGLVVGEEDAARERRRTRRAGEVGARTVGRDVNQDFLGRERAPAPGARGRGRARVGVKTSVYAPATDGESFVQAVPSTAVMT